MNPEEPTVTHCLRILVATLPALLAACAGPGTATAPASVSGNALALEGPPYGDGPVELLFDGTDSGRCDWRLVARYPKNTAPHGIDIQAVYTDSRDGRTISESGTAEYLPNPEPDVSRMVDGAVETELWSWDDSASCADIRATIRIGECYKAPCPRYVAGPNRVPVQLDLSYR